MQITLLESFKVGILALIFLAVYILHIDIIWNITHFRALRDKQISTTNQSILYTPPSPKPTHKYQPQLDIIRENQFSCKTFKRPHKRQNILPPADITASYFSIPDCDNLPPPAEDL